MEIIKSEVGFKLNGKPHQFFIFHTVPNIEDAVINWSTRTKEYTAESLVNYINSKGVHEAWTEEQFKETDMYNTYLESLN